MNPNCVAKRFFDGEYPRICIFASEDIPAYIELRYSYGDDRDGHRYAWRQVKTHAAYLCIILKKLTLIANQTGLKIYLQIVDMIGSNIFFSLT